jgi:undecaprenyl-phosphate galactose phosphotransferase
VDTTSIPDNSAVAADSCSAHPRSFAAKRTFDLISSLCALILLSPVFVAAAIALKIAHTDVPVFIGLEVLGAGRQRFRMWKFSTMAKDAHLVLPEMLERNAELKQEWERNVKLAKDPRILPGIGHFLRQTSLNELPQLFNVLKGEMSIVGPRPISVAEEALYLRFGGPQMLQRRHAQRPGITGLWQATGRSDVSYRERVELDGEYLATQNMWQDFKILYWTLKKVISREGAI